MTDWKPVITELECGQLQNVSLYALIRYQLIISRNAIESNPAILMLRAGGHIVLRDQAGLPQFIEPGTGHIYKFTPAEPPACAPAIMDQRFNFNRITTPPLF